jgi:ribosome-associated toxin RatA of RatAB toxin-antitoxin module
VKIYTSDDFNNKTMFFLDAHIQNYKKRCPLFEELSAIENMERKDHVILIDDLRIIKTAYPWNETSYGNINFLEQIKNKILSINKHYKFATLNGHIDDDVLIAYI